MRLIERIKQHIAEQHVFYSFEYFPPSSERGRRNLQLRIDRMADMQPIMVDVTCSHGRVRQTLEVCRDVIRYCGVDVMMHLPCVGMERIELLEILNEAKQAGVRNVLAMYGDVPPGASRGDFARSVDVVRLIREHFGDSFTIAVPGYPEGLARARRDIPGPGRMESEEDNYRRHIQYLLEKVEAGADFCISDVCYDAAKFVQFVRDCHAAGIARTFPIIPGLMPIHSYESFQSIVAHLGLGVPQNVTAKLEQIKGDRAAVLEYGIELAEAMALELLNSGLAQGLHFYTLNLEYAVRALLEERLKVTPKSRLPWRPSANPKRVEEDVRPIFWANRPKSYLMRTESWDQFPSGRWASVAGDASFGALRESGLFARETFFERNDVKRKAWGEAPISEEEVFDVFAGFVEGRVPFLPWCEESLHLETSVIQTRLAKINRAGFLTINSQPRINAAPSSNPQFGWGPDGGYVYQKAYIEFFTSPRKLRRLIDLLATPEFASRHLEFHAVDRQGNTYSNAKRRKACAVTWGVFPGKEVIQPTVVDPDAFLVWKDEAFALWVRGWASIYDEGSPSYDLLHDMHDQYFLVNIVDNDFVDGDIFDIFEKLVETKR